MDRIFILINEKLFHSNEYVNTHKNVIYKSNAIH